MAKELTPIDITTDHDLIRLAEEVRRTGKARLLRRGDEDLAVLSPAPISAKYPGAGTKTTPEDDAAFLASAGSWKGLVDADSLKRTIRDERSDDRPPVRL